MHHDRTTSTGIIFCLLLTRCGLSRADDLSKSLVLADNGQSQYTIVVADTASPSTRYGAKELQRFLQEITGAQFPIMPDKRPMSEHEIILGTNKHFHQLMQSTNTLDDLDLQKLGPEGYRIQTLGKHVVIAGGDLRGNLYGVYGLLEDHLGCRWFTPEVSQIPVQDRLLLPRLKETKVPALEYREPFVRDCQNGDWCARNRMNSSAALLEQRHGGKVRFGRGMFVHTFNILIPPDKYFDKHPEYFSEINGIRTKERTQLCCTNADVIRICTEEMRQHMRDDPGAYVFSLSQNDWDNYCECSQCQAVAKREGSQMGPVLQLVNHVAEALEDEFPNIAIETLAYQWTRKPPKNIRPKPNVIIRLCSIECCFMHPLDGCNSEENQTFVADLNAWSPVADRLWVWDYVTTFKRYLTPFPNLRVRDDNIRLFIMNNVTGIFEQDVYNTFNGELSGLSGYLNAKLLWNPYYDEDMAIDEFLAGVYGPAAKPIRVYIDLIHDKVEKENIHTDIWVHPTAAPYLTDKLLENASQLWNEAEQLAAQESDPKLLERVRFARLPIEYSIIEKEFDKVRLAPYELDHEHFRIQPSRKPECIEYLDRVKSFFKVAKQAQVSRLGEQGLHLDQYQSTFQKLLWQEPRTLEPLEPIRSDATQPGLAYAYYEAEKGPSRNFEELVLIKRGTCTGFDIDVRERDEMYAIRFTGYLCVSQDGIYTFAAKSDSVRLFIGPEIIVGTNDQNRELFENKTGRIALKAGLHPLVLEYFQNEGTAPSPLTYAGPRFEQRIIEPAVLQHRP